MQWCFAIKIKKLLIVSFIRSQKFILKSLLIAKIAFVLPCYMFIAKMSHWKVWSYNQLSWELIPSKTAQTTCPLVSFIDELLSLLLITQNKVVVDVVELLSRVY